MMRQHIATVALLLTSCLAGAADPAAVEHFEKAVRPLLLDKCLKCHGGEKVKGGLSLKSRAEMVKGGESGSALDDKSPETSLLLKAVRYTDETLKMPPSGKLPDHEIAAVEKWLRDGAPWPESTPTATNASKTGPLFTDEQKKYWAFQPVVRPAVPKGAAHPIDAFLRQKLDAAGLKPSPPADKRTLLRRVSFDLIGLPPTPEELAAFEQDTSSQAFEKVVDRLLANPAYGERWAKHWLDVARYADTNGMDENTTFGNAWRYRDYVVRSLNADKPYDQFVTEQLAGDLLPTSDDAAVTADRHAALGYLVIGPKLLAEPDKQKMLLDIADEQLDTVGKSLMGLTLGCARCHDHKFDPIPQRDYFSLLGTFTSTRTMQNLNTVAKALEKSPDGAEKAEVAKDRQRLEAVRKEVRQIEKEFGKTAETDTAKRQELHAKAEVKRAEIKKLEASLPIHASFLVVEEGSDAAYGTRPRNLAVQVRGNYLTAGEEAPAVFPRILAGETQQPFVPTKPNPADKPEATKIRYGQVRDRSGRLELARWLTDPKHPLTARVMVNRLWQHLFGEGLVRTPDNFGRLGERPTHPELLDWLAAELASPLAPSGASDKPWTLKRIHRLMLLSEAYQQSTIPNAALRTRHSKDPDNRLLAYFPRRRLEAEAVRDAMLAVAGTLDRSVGGSLYAGPNLDYVGEVKYDSTRRSLYLPVVRGKLFDFFQTFDHPDPAVTVGKRASTVVAPQALYLMNNPFVLQQATAFANAILASSSDDTARLTFAYRRAYQRDPTADEAKRAIEFIRDYEKTLDEKDVGKRHLSAWSAFAQTLFASSEFLFVE